MRLQLERTRAGICHGHQEGAVVLQLEVLILELLAVDALAAGTITGGEVAALDHELLDDAVELRALVVERLAALSLALLAGAQGAKVVSGLWDDVVVQLYNDATCLALADVHLEEDATTRRRLGLLGSHFVGR